MNLKQFENELKKIKTGLYQSIDSIFQVIEVLNRELKFKDQLLSQLLNDASDKYYCSVCESKLKFFNPLPVEYQENAERYGYKHFGRCEMTAIETYSCPLCGASDRERLYAHWMNDQIGITLHCESDIIHFAPETALSQWIRKKGFTNYKTADLMMNQVDYNVDICNLPFSDEQYDFFICSHVLEHVFDDDLAISELYRITKKSGIGILMAPISVDLERTIENPNIKDISERWRLFGQDDHVRLYAHDDYVSKIKKHGFFVKELNKDHFNNEYFQLLGIKSTSILYIVQKSI